jgi:hypothetical protein
VRDGYVDRRAATTPTKGGNDSMIACNKCVFGKQHCGDHFTCSHPVYAKIGGKNIYPETFRVLKKVGCNSAKEEATT